MLNLHPDCVMYYIGFPEGPNHTTVLSEFLFRPETIAAADFKPEPVVELWDTISKQDWAVVSARRPACRRALTRGSTRAGTASSTGQPEEWRRAMGRETLG